MRLHRLALLIALVAVPARAADATSVQLVPADVAFYTASLQLGEQMERFLKSNAYAKLKALPAAKLAAQHLREAAGQRDNPVAHVMQALKDPANKELLDLLIDMPRQDIFFYGGGGWADLIPLLQRLNSAQRFAPLQALLGGQDPGKAQGRAMLQTLNAIADKLAVPELVLGFRLSNAAPATAQIKRLEEHLSQQIDQVPELKGRLKRTKVGGADALTFNLDGSLIPIESIPWSEIEEQEGEFQKLRLRLKSLTLTVSLMVKNDYLLLTVGPHAGVAEKFAAGPGLASRPELAPMAKFADRKLIAVGYSSQALSAAADTTADDITSLLDMAKTGLDKLPIPEKRREAIDKDLKQLAKALLAELDQPGAGLAFTFLSDRGQETYSYDYSVTPHADAPKQLSIAEHLGGSPLIALAGVTGDPTPGYREMVKWIKIIYGHAEATAKEMFPDSWQQFEQGLDMVLPFVKKFDDITGNQFFPALGDGESALVIDAKWTSKQWHKDFDQGGKDLPMLEIGFVRTVKDSAKVLTALGGYRELANEIMEKAKQFGAQAPEGGLPKPQSKKVSGGTVYFWPLPPVGQDQQVQPNLGLSDTLLAAGLSVTHTERLLAKTPLTTDGGPLTEKRPALGIVVVDFAGFVGAVRPWVEQFAVPLALEHMPDKTPPGISKGDIPDQVRTVFDVLGCLRKYTSVTYREGTATVTHSELVIRDLK
jgi:hypothetical protein